MKVALFRVSAASTFSGSRAAAWLAWRMRLGAFDNFRPGAPHPNRADVLLAERGRAIDPRL